MTEPVTTEKPILAPEKKMTTSSFSYFSIVAVIIAGISLALTLYHNDISQKWANNQSEQMNQLDKKQQAFEQFATKADKIFMTKIADINTNIEAFKQQTRYGNDDWLMLKARYYLELAQIQAHWGDNTPTTIALLQEADNVLASINNAKLFEVRQALAKEISELQILPVLDQVGLLSQLDALQERIDDLPIQSTLTMPKTTPKPTQSSWSSYWQNSINTLEKMVIIRHNDHAIKPLFSSLELSLLRETLRNNLQQAQWAVLRHNEKIYQMALSKTIKKIKNTFNMQEPTTINFLQALTKLQKTPLSSQPTLDLETSLERLNQLINTPLLDAKP